MEQPTSLMMRRTRITCQRSNWGSIWILMIETGSQLVRSCWSFSFRMAMTTTVAWMPLTSPSCSPRIHRRRDMDDRRSTKANQSATGTKSWPSSSYWRISSTSPSQIQARTRRCSSTTSSQTSSPKPTSTNTSSSTLSTTPTILPRTSVLTASTPRCSQRQLPQSKREEYWNSSAMTDAHLWCNIYYTIILYHNIIICFNFTNILKLK